MLVHRSPRTLATWVGVALAALLAARVLASDLATLHARAASAGAEVAAVVATRDLPLGHTIEPNDLDAVVRYERHVPDGAFASPDDAVGRVVATPLVRDAIVTRRHLAAPDRSGLDGIVPDGMRAVRVVVDEPVDLAPGSVVDVLVTFDPALIPPEIEPTTTVVAGAVVLRSAPPGSRDYGGATGAATLLVDEPASRRLAFAAANGIVTLALAPPEEACCRKPSSTRSSGSSRG